MWKDSYNIGVDLIDKQHRELFGMVGNLLEVIESGKANTKKECKSALAYMREYTLKHFADEEAYQKSINYHGLLEHKAIHQKFVQTVVSHERKMIKSDFNINEIKDFLGTLISWLVYHVAGADQLIVKEQRDELYVKPHASIESFFFASICDVFTKMIGLDIKDLSVLKYAVGDVNPAIYISVNFNGKISGTIAYQFTQQFAFHLMHTMASVSSKQIDELVCSAMMEISNIINVQAFGLMSARGFPCQAKQSAMHIAPAFLPSTKSLVFDMGKGFFEMEVNTQ